MINKVVSFFRTLSQKNYIKKIYKKYGSKGVQKLINLSMKEIAKDAENNLSQEEVEKVSALLSKAMEK